MTLTSQSWVICQNATILDIMIMLNKVNEDMKMNALLLGSNINKELFRKELNKLETKGNRKQAAVM